MFEGISNLAGLMKNARELQARAQEMKSRLATIRVEGMSGGGMVRVEATGEQKITSVTVDTTLLQSGDKEMLEDLVKAAVNQALEHSREAAAGEMSNLAGGLGVPGLEEAFAKFGLGP